ncbi:hypothetical protein Poly21_39430 [Allorhodopirellula heiligendammensis]|uniref:Uncharacterized protein n=1 Tax=Allorhodopirellula heiligendammensis TaxID=2714739 RepID=A0A5C6BYH6_9BACT|nr:hypothetical protein Poly21_39430 [Allorhodopirellula heiligendammensis]
MDGQSAQASEMTTRTLSGSRLGTIGTIGVQLMQGSRASGISRVDLHFSRAWSDWRELEQTTM